MYEESNKDSVVRFSVETIKYASAGKPYTKTIAHMKELLAKKSAPMQKILDLNKNRAILTDEI